MVTKIVISAEDLGSRGGEKVAVSAESSKKVAKDRARSKILYYKPSTDLA